MAGTLTGMALSDVDRARLEAAAATLGPPPIPDEERLATLHQATPFDVDEITRGLVERGIVTRDWYEGFQAGRRHPTSA